MKYFYSRFNSAEALLTEYTAPEPFHIASKAFFKGKKKYGSKDRKAITELCYTYWRAGLSFTDLSLKKRLLWSSLLLGIEDIAAWNKIANELGIDHELDEEYAVLQNNVAYLQKATGITIHFYPEQKLMDRAAHYNKGINALYRPKNWAKDHASETKGSLDLEGCITILHNDKLEKTVQVQDLSSQYVCNKIRIRDGEKVWDVCSGAGGKSLNLASQGNGNYYLTDVRQGILQNARKRMTDLHYDAKYAAVDLSQHQEFLRFEKENIPQEYFDKIVIDVPCSGSGTWFRTPENFSNFSYDSLSDYITRQKDIVRNAIPFLQAEGDLYYITCSVFAEENTEMKEWIVKNTKLSMKEEVFFDGIGQGADAMYMVHFTKTE